MKIVENQRMDEERALYNLQNARVSNCRFEGPLDGESALKEGRNLEIDRCVFALRLSPVACSELHGFRLYSGRRLSGACLVCAKRHFREYRCGRSEMSAGVYPGAV